ncbi:hypothetical protein CVT26_001161 [Gymnopilus dilepis]|uniref:SRR1-like domain-containing protein n=1 Tax=Gymnopilus dilepis TaxID=231916 RepID=A0A409YLN8_9AGAR|nr:hypothetical protein CVT26_001161 [Gymnopilus dilepis]
MAEASFPYSDFTPVKSRKKRKNRPTRTLSISSLLSPLQEHIRQSEWFAECSQILVNSWHAFCPARPPAVLCLGLGSPSLSQNARTQLAFLTEACKLLNVVHEEISIYDPVFTQEDTAFLERELQMKSANYTLAVPTLCFMPHCDIELYDALLRANWSREGLSRLFLLGNQLREYLENKSTRALESTVPHLLRAAPLLENRPFPTSSDWPTAFNNTAVQYFRSQTDIGDLVQAEPRPPVAEVDRSEETVVGEGNNEPTKGETAAEGSQVSSPRPTPRESE